MHQGSSSNYLDVTDLMNVKQFSWFLYKILNNNLWMRFHNIKVKGVFIQSKSGEIPLLATNLTKLYASAIACSDLDFVNNLCKLEILVIRD